VGRKLDAVLNDLKSVRGRNSGPPEIGGPFGGQGPTVNGAPIDPQVPTVTTATKESHVLNDAILQAALDLNRRLRTRRKVIFLLSEGRELGSKASYRDVLKVLLSNNIMVYAVGVEGAAIPGYSKLQRLHLPRFGVGDILPKYANATGGEVFSEFSREAIENAYARALDDARNQYTLGYVTKATPSSTYREIEVRLAGHGPSCRSSYRPCVDVTAKPGYYPMAISR
jgi:VWFA-related protein